MTLTQPQTHPQPKALTHFDLSIPMESIKDFSKKYGEDKRHFLESGHFGTHLDAYEKTKIPLHYSISNGRFFDVSHQIDEDNDHYLSFNQLDEIQEGDFVIIYTGHLTATGYGTPTYFANHPQIAKNTLDSIAKKKIHFLGIDIPGPRRGKEHVPMDREFEYNGSFVIENLNLLNLLKEELLQNKATPLKIYCSWWTRPEITGYPCKVLAILGD